MAAVLKWGGKFPILATRFFGLSRRKMTKMSKNGPNFYRSWTRGFGQKVKILKSDFQNLKNFPDPGHRVFSQKMQKSRFLPILDTRFWPQFLVGRFLMRAWPCPQHFFTMENGDFWRLDFSSFWVKFLVGRGGPKMAEFLRKYPYLFFGYFCPERVPILKSNIFWTRFEGPRFQNPRVPPGGPRILKICEKPEFSMIFRPY